MTRVLQHPAWRFAQWLGFLALLTLLWWRVDLGQTFALLASVSWPWLVLGVFLLTVQTLLSAQRWRLTAGRLGQDIGVWHAVREYYLAQLINQSLPGGVLGDAGRAIRARGEAGLLASGQAVLFERISGQLGLLALLMPGIFLLLLPGTAINIPTGLRSALWTLLCLPIGLGLIAFALSRHASISATISRLGMAAFRHAVLAREVLPRQAALSLGTALCNLLGFACAAAAIGEVLPLGVIFSLVPLILFAMVLPLSIAGWGLREGAAVVVLPLVGIDANAALAASLTFGLIFLFSTVPGWIVTWLRPNAPVIGPR